jgi:hypothetical protein
LGIKARADTCSKRLFARRVLVERAHLVIGHSPDSQHKRFNQNTKIRLSFCIQSEGSLFGTNGQGSGPRTHSVRAFQARVVATVGIHFPWSRRISACTQRSTPKAKRVDRATTSGCVSLYQPNFEITASQIWIQTNSSGGNKEIQRENKRVIRLRLTLIKDLLWSPCLHTVVRETTCLLTSSPSSRQPKHKAYSGSHNFEIKQYKGWSFPFFCLSHDVIRESIDWRWFARGIQSFSVQK